ncbi:MAG: KamA family radical SAM protein, partial [Deltaproteobacteria bacterium]
MFPEKITTYYKSLINTKEPHDPLAKMVLYSSAEKNICANESADPIGDGLYSQGRLIHRYHKRALLMVSGRCPAHCRFCFRRSLAREDMPDISNEEIDSAIKYLHTHCEIEEIIFSGGDPLSLSNIRLIEIVDAIRTIKSIHKIRIHTRYPVYDPSRCDDIDELASKIDVFVLHINHSREITPCFRQAIKNIRCHAHIFNQTVLLKGVNDSLTELVALSNALFSCGIIPYYLHYPDRAYGTSHFCVGTKTAKSLMQELQEHFPEMLEKKEREERNLFAFLNIKPGRRVKTGFPNFSNSFLTLSIFLTSSITSVFVRTITSSLSK